MVIYVGIYFSFVFIKGVVLNMVDDFGFVGLDYYYGWGWINVCRVLYVLENN